MSNHITVNDDMAERLGRCYARLVELGRRRQERLTRQPAGQGFEGAGRPPDSNTVIKDPDLQDQAKPETVAVRVIEAQDV